MSKKRRVLLTTERSDITADLYRCLGSLSCVTGFSATRNSNGTLELAVDVDETHPLQRGNRHTLPNLDFSRILKKTLREKVYAPETDYDLVIY